MITITIVVNIFGVFATTAATVGAPAISGDITMPTLSGSKWLPRQDGGRVLVATWLLASLVFMSSYSGILTAMITLPRVTIPIDSLADLVAQDELPWKVEGGTSLHQYFKVSGSSVLLLRITACCARRQSFHCIHVGL